MGRKDKNELVLAAARAAAREAALETAALQKLDPIEAKRVADEAKAEHEARRRGRITYRLRRHLAPWKAAAVVLVVAAVLWAVAWWTMETSAAVLLAAIAGAGLTVAAWFRSKKAGQWAGRVRLGAIAADAWLVLAAVTGPSWWVVLVLVLTTVALSLGWWRSIPVGLRPDGPQFASAEVRLGPVHERWQKYVANKAGALPESYLTDCDDSADHKISYTGQMVPGRHTLSHALANVDKIASGLDVPVRNIVLEPHPSESPSQFRLTVVTRSPIAETVEYTGPKVDNGLVMLGPYADGEGYASWRLWTPGEVPNGGSAWGGFVLGGMGSGKSRLMELLCIGAQSTGYVNTWFLDPQGGASSPALKEAADWYGDLSDARHFLEALEGIAAARGREMDADGWIGYDADPDRPILQVVIDECHEVFADKRLIDRWEKLSRKIRKLGITFVGLSQYGGLPTFGNKEPLRASMYAGNIVVMRSESKNSGQLVPGLDLDPMSLPALPGFGYTVARGNHGRTAPQRAEYVADPHAWLQRYPNPGLDRLASHGSGSAYRNRHAQAEANRVELRRAVDAMRAGREVITVKPIVTPPPAVEVPAADRGSWFTPLPAPTLSGNVVPMVRPDRGVTGASDATGARSGVAVASRPSNAGDTSDGRTALQVRPAILAHLGNNGPSTTGELIEMTGASETRVRQILSELMGAGQVEKLKRGVYRRVGDKREHA